VFQIMGSCKNESEETFCVSRVADKNSGLMMAKVVLIKIMIMKIGKMRDFTYAYIL
jgi:hypothetical protein